MDKRTVSPFPLRLEPDIRKALEDCARQNERSLQAEITARLLESMGLQSNEERKEEDRIRRIVLEELSKQSKKI